MLKDAPQDIRERAFEFAVRVVRLCKFLEHNSDVDRSLSSQLLRSGTSIGANLEEAKAGQSSADFVHKNAIALKEARESVYWLRIILATADLPESAVRGLDHLQTEATELCRIIAKIIVTAKKNKAA